MTMHHTLLAGTFCLGALAAGPAPHAETITLPQETATFRESTLPGYNLVLRNCMVCHSAQYVLTQPPTLGRAYWEATVKKMKAPFGAPFPEEDMPAMVDYLVKTYGAERPAGAKAPER
ncbi:sulfite:cytochrome C oxidoreductase subunit B [Cupriavidus sp. USMAA2-4]|uniref:Sulfite:cytochrome C oxidoreductase subunit B n=1 Tax=Cupriavidus malaysiensis TaxID=367825 RepID=A0A1D9IDA4_9BURK|nr:MULTISPECIES: sulfite:cytochrome C oxidoreductase subunit B [Cupriavidus]AOY94590.1 sulfite:cytochrome C oxidoreductase subunit B [Cupriavidus sp. USMAA2-4]AOZ02559.1 sulfite:cytochrome C oxidoreductase subunit B [Cupriavidus sp. USMAHM13]AOZ10087.1 sulfite:cytochrome C oxidoreductase subunit B [Cupriavidus malaysiensis]